MTNWKIPARIELQSIEQQIFGGKKYVEHHNAPAFNANDEACFIRLLDSREQQRRRAARRQQDADRTRLISALKTVGIAALDLALVLFIICTVF